jgi:hypothetical protein
VVSFVVAPLSLLGIFLPVAWPLELGHWVLEWLMWFLHAMDGLPLAVWRQHEPLAWTLPLAMLGVAAAACRFSCALAGRIAHAADVSARTGAAAGGRGQRYCARRRPRVGGRS